VRDTVNSWPEVDLVVALGDLCEDNGSLAEYQVAQQFFGKLKKPQKFIVGNHDYLYSDQKQDGKRIKASPQERQAKLERFKSTFGLSEYYYSMKVGSYFLVFLSVDDLNSSFLTVISDRQLQWLEQQLQANRTMPTIIFCHGPLEGTLIGKNEVTNSMAYMMQPRVDIKRILTSNRQVFLWVAGHDHIAPTNAAFNNPVNLYQNQVYNLHNPALKGTNHRSENDWGSTKCDALWANFIKLYPDHVDIRTYDFTNSRWLGEHDRTLRPKLSGTASFFRAE
jgi:Icc protein